MDKNVLKEKICEETEGIVSIANYNCPGQIVITGEEAAVAAATDTEQLYMMIAVYLVLSAVFTPLAICVLYKISKNENRVSQLCETLPKHSEGKMKIATVSFWLASIVAVGYIIYDMVATKLY